MKWTVTFNVKDYVRSWSNQIINTSYKDIRITVSIWDKECILCVEGTEGLEEVFYLVWELLFLYDGYFYEPKHWQINDVQKDVKSLYKLSFYKTDHQWLSEGLLGRGKRDLSTEVIERYDIFRNTTIADKKMTKSVVNAFYYLQSKDYGKINVNHRLSLLLNVADGFVINTHKETNNVKASLDKLFKNTIDIEKLQKGISLMGLSGEQYKSLLAQERHTFDHFLYSENSIATFVHDSQDDKSNYITWYFVYVMNLVLRINFLKISGVNLEKEIMDYALSIINDWIIYENNLDIQCSTSCYQMRQMRRKLKEIFC